MTTNTVSDQKLIWFTSFGAPLAPLSLAFKQLQLSSKISANTARCTTLHKYIIFVVARMASKIAVEIKAVAAEGATDCTPMNVQ